MPQPIRPLAVAMLIVGATLAGCTGRTPAAAEEQPSMAQASLTVSLATEASRHAPGAPVAARVTLTNDTDSAVVLPFSSAQRIDLFVLDADGQEVRRWSSGRGFAQVIGRLSLEPGDSETFEAMLPAPDAAGTYRLVAMITAMSQQPADTIPLVVD